MPTRPVEQVVPPDKSAERPIVQPTDKTFVAEPPASAGAQEPDETFVPKQPAQAKAPEAEKTVVPEQSAQAEAQIPDQTIVVPRKAAKPSPPESPADEATQERMAELEAKVEVLVSTLANIAPGGKIAFVAPGRLDELQTLATSTATDEERARSLEDFERAREKLKG